MDLYIHNEFFDIKKESFKFVKWKNGVHHVIHYQDDSIKFYKQRGPTLFSKTWYIQIKHVKC